MFLSLVKGIRLLYLVLLFPVVVVMLYSPIFNIKFLVSDKIDVCA